MGGGPGWHVLLIPGIALVAIGVLCLALRWIYGTGPSLPPGTPPPSSYGLLVPLVTLAPGPARRVQERLRAGGVRATTAPAGGGNVALLVFEGDVRQARDLLASRG